MMEIPIANRNYPAMVDDEDFQRFSTYRWECNPAGYVYRSTSFRNNGIRHYRKFAMHREVLGAPPGSEVDHIDFVLHNNQIANLRIVTKQLNMAHSRGYINRPRFSRFKGVYLERRSQIRPWFAQIRVNYRSIRLGSFETQEEAALSYNAAALKHFGEFAHLNLVTTGLV